MSGQQWVKDYIKTKLGINRMDNKLKEIRSEYCLDGSMVLINSDTIKTIQEASYQLGRDEVIGWGNLPLSELEKLWQSAIDVKDYAQASFILYLINTKQDYSKIQEIMQRDKLGMGGECIVDVLIQEYNSLKSK